MHMYSLACHDVINEIFFTSDRHQACNTASRLWLYELYDFGESAHNLIMCTFPKVQPEIILSLVQP